ncbi:hypothetical protein [Nocardiopsis tropica]|uniref:Uncharacterized protein n=1 Tax=Nocardiopsis tropica TaxID=109330 RepID=A0ABU7KR16_9ACTN|nr:hypothetical protein [Nocardiopsis umidischolae]MEE2051751.1 hypothetical protein [Nocardiopsis umidischolae]
MGHITRTDTHLPPHLYASDLTVSDTGVHIELAAGLHITTLHMTGDTADLLADLDTLTVALDEVRRRLEQRAAFAEYDVPAPRPASEVEFIIAAEWTQVAR